MFKSLRVRAVVVLAGAAATLAFAAQPAQAVVDPHNCTYFHNGNIMTATCTNNTQSGWYYRLQCMRYGNSHIYYANGTAVYGSGTSQATCGNIGEPIGGTIVNF